MTHVHANAAFASLGLAVLTVSDTRGLDEDGSGDLLAERLTAAGHALVERRIVPDDVYRIRAVVSAWVVRDDIQVVLPEASRCASRRGAVSGEASPRPASVLVPGREDGGSGTL